MSQVPEDDSLPAQTRPARSSSHTGEQATIAAAAPGRPGSGAEPIHREPTTFRGFVGGSSLERLPIEVAVAARTWAFKSTAIQVRIERETVDALEAMAGDHGRAPLR